MGNLLAPLAGPFNLFFYEPIYNLLMVIYELIHLVLPAGAFAAAIIVLTLLLRCAMIPLTRKQLKSSREMQVLQPRLKELQAQYKNNPQELMAAQRALYKEHGVNPASGCLPLVIQMPFLYALYGAFLTVLPRTSEAPSNLLAHINGDLYPFVPKLHALPNIHFLWTSLGTPDPLHILPVLAAILTFVQLRMAMPVRKKPAPGTAAQSDPTTQATSMMQYIMPFFTLFIGWTFPAGLALYWCVSTGFSAVQQYFISGWGSLFVGVPGMEHLVPAPKELPALPARTPSTARALTSGAPAQPAGEGGIRGMFKQLRDTMAAAQQPRPSEQTQQPPAAPRAQPKPQASQPPEPASKAETSAAQTRRARPSREGPMLIKPKTSTSAEELPERAIAREASGGAPETNGELPEQAIARLGSGDGMAGARAGGTNGTHAHKSTPGASGSRGPSARPGTTQRKATGKNTNAPRSRGGRPKGGR